MAKDLMIHPYAQRELVPSKLKSLTKSLDLDAIGIIHAVDCNIGGVDGVWVIDGQHRVKALMEVGFGDWLVDCVIHADAADEQKSCDLFLKLNDRAAVYAYDKFMAEVRAGHASAVGATAVVESKGLAIGRTSAAKTITAVMCLKKAWALDNGISLARALEAMIQAWGTSAHCMEGKVIEAISTIFHRYGQKIDGASFVQKMAKFPGGPARVVGVAKGHMEVHRVSLARAIANTLIDAYNHGKRSGVLEAL